MKVLDGQGQQSDSVAVRLAFFGTNPRLAVWVQRTDAEFGVGVHVTRSDNGGSSWSAPVVIPRDGSSSTDFPFSLALDSHGNATLGYGRNGGSGDALWGNPKLATSSDFANWTVSSAGGTAALSITTTFSSFPASLQVLYGLNDRIYLLWSENGASATGTGLILYREPPAGQGSAPSLDNGSLANGATYVSGGLVPGSWAQVKGANLSDVTRIWGDADFPTGTSPGTPLPANLSGVEVKVNGLPAAVYYITPTQVNFQVPTGVTGTASVQVFRNGLASNTVTAAAATNAPGFFPYVVAKKNYPAAVFLDGKIVGDPAVAATDAVRKAKPGDTIQFFVTGLVPVTGGVSVGFQGVSGVSVKFGDITVAADAAGLVAVGEFQVNATVPQQFQTLPEGNYPITLSVNGQSSPVNINSDPVGPVIVPIVHN